MYANLKIFMNPKVLTIFGKIIMILGNSRIFEKMFNTKKFGNSKKYS